MDKERDFNTLINLITHSKASNNSLENYNQSGTTNNTENSSNSVYETLGKYFISVLQCSYIVATKEEQNNTTSHTIFLEGDLKSRLAMLSILAGGDGIINPYDIDKDYEDARTTWDITYTYTFYKEDDTEVFRLVFVEDSFTKSVKSIKMNKDLVSLSYILETIFNIKSYKAKVDLTKYFNMVDYTTLEKDTHVLVSNDNMNWVNANFSHYKDDVYYVFSNGKSSWTTVETVPYKYIKLGD